VLGRCFWCLISDVPTALRQLSFGCLFASGIVLRVGVARAIGMPGWSVVVLAIQFTKIARTAWLLVHARSLSKVLAESLVLSNQLSIGALITLSLDASALHSTQLMLLVWTTRQTLLASWRSLSSLDWQSRFINSAYIDVVQVIQKVLFLLVQVHCCILWVHLSVMGLIN
jgi:hypothetical protein